MSQQAKAETSGHAVELLTFHIGDVLCGLNILNVQEIRKPARMTTVPQAPDYVLGIFNLRGQIVTLIDLGKKLGLGETAVSDDQRAIIVNAADGVVGLLVKKIGDVVEADMTKIELPPANMRGIHGEFFMGVCTTPSALIGILDIDRVLSTED